MAQATGRDIDTDLGNAAITIARGYRSQGRPAQNLAVLLPDQPAELVVLRLPPGPVRRLGLERGFAGVEPLVGLYGAFMMGLITAVIGGRPGMISGATGASLSLRKFAPMV